MIDFCFELYWAVLCVGRKNPSRTLEENYLVLTERWGVPDPAATTKSANDVPDHPQSTTVDMAPDDAQPEPVAETSKKGAKKAEAKAKKEAEKARRQAERKAAEAVKNEDTVALDAARDDYGEVDDMLPPMDGERISIRSLQKEHVGKIIAVRAWIQNLRSQRFGPSHICQYTQSDPSSANMVFIELREEGDWTIQALVVADKVHGRPSRPMVKWIAGLKPESFVAVEAKVQEPLEPVKSCRILEYELAIHKCYVLAAAPGVLGMTLAASNRAITNFNDEEPSEKASEIPDAPSKSAIPAATMLTHLDNIVMHKRAPVQQAIADIRAEMKELFRSYLRSYGFKEFEPPCLIGAASEGGANVFSLPYFGKQAFLVGLLLGMSVPKSANFSKAQSPQFYKQMEIAGGRKRVYSIGPVFRAENSNTPRHMTEV